MPRQPHEFRAIHQAADRFEPRLRREYVRAIRRLRARMPVLLRLDARQSVITRRELEQALEPLVKVFKDAGRTGGKIGATRIEGALRDR